LEQENAQNAFSAEAGGSKTAELPQFL